MKRLALTVALAALVGPVAAIGINEALQAWRFMRSPRWDREPDELRALREAGL